ncbi:MAG: pyruvate kinase [Bacteroidales bacterium]|nr:pyruvate kinase [Bacteroidales bacterium]
MLLKQTKIVATISDRRCDVDFIKELFEAGMNVVRINTAHQTLDDTLKVINNVRQISDRIPILIDTKGPEIRTTKTDEEITLKQDQIIHFKGDPFGTSTKKCICASYEKFVDEVPVGSEILIDDGELAFTVLSKDKEKLECKVLNDGYLGSRKSINVPGVAIALPSLTSKDREYIQFAMDQNVAFIAHSFVRNKEDVTDIQKILDENDSKVKIIAKIENKQGVENIDEIIDHAYGVMVARGDLGIEIPAEKIPGIQKNIVKKCIERRKPVIVATQMLYTMIQNPRPTRAEVSDVANAIYEGTDAIMLSGETAFGKYPLETVKTMTRIAQQVEKNKRDFKEPSDKALHNKLSGHLAKAAIQATVKLPVKCVVADSMKGRTIRNLAAFRGKLPILAFCYDKRLMRELALSYGVKTYFLSQRNSTDQFYHSLTKILLEEGKIELEDTIVVLAGNFGPGKGASFIEISTIESLSKRALKNTP